MAAPSGAAMLLACGMLAACKPAAKREAVDVASEPAVATSEPSPSVPDVAIGPLTRADLIAAADRAADAYADGRPGPEENRALVDRNFELRLPLGCRSGPMQPWGSLSFDPKQRVVRLTAQQENWGEDAWVRELASGLDFESAEGFWIERPWTSSETCPRQNAVPTQAPQVAPSGHAPKPLPPGDGARQTLGLAEFFAPGTPRTMQRGERPYAFTLKVNDAGEPQNMDLVVKLTGRIESFPDGVPVHCQTDDPNARPRCLIAVEFTRVAFEDRAAGKTIAEWIR